MSSSRYQKVLDMVDRTMTEGASRGFIHLTLENESLDGRSLRIRGRDMLNFGNCSYMGLELDKRLARGAIEATLRYGTQFSSSRSYVSCSLYEELESLLAKVFCVPEGQVIVTPSTTMGHQCVLPVLVQPGDLFILDQQVHASVRMAADLTSAREAIEVVQIPHNQMDILEDRIKTAGTTGTRVWYLMDSLYSMYGDFAPMSHLADLMDRYEHFYIYVDDAHGMSWYGHHGRGYALDQIGLHPKMVVASSLNKAFGSGGGAIIFPNREWARRTRACSDPLTFTGPLQPPVLGANVASARIHLSPEMPVIQDELASRIAYCNEAVHRYGLEHEIEADSPIFFIRMGTRERGVYVVENLLQEGFYVNIASFPAVPVTGIRFTLTRHQPMENIDRLLATMARYQNAFTEQGIQHDKES